MKKLKSILKWTGITVASLIVFIVGFGFWFMSLIPSSESRGNLEQTKPGDLPYLNQPIGNKGKVLAVVTSTDRMGTSDKKTGYELTELSRAYYVFEANGFTVDIASPLGGTPPVIIDQEDMGGFDYAFLNDERAQAKVKNTISMDQVNPEDYEAIYFVGGKGAMFDFPENKHIQSIVSNYYQRGKVVGAVCHGPAALVNVKLDDGTSLLANKQVCSFTNNEELLLIPDAKQIFPFLLQDKLTEQGAQFNDGFMYLNNVSADGNLVTGQNPWSTWNVAESMIEQMGLDPVEREVSAEEITVDLLVYYEEAGYSEAKKRLNGIYASQQPFDRLLLAKHGIIAGWRGKIGKAVNIIRLTSHAKSLAIES